MTWRTVDELLGWLAGLPPTDAVRVARLLADTKTAGALRAYADQVVFEMTRQATYGEVAAELGLSHKQVTKAVERRLAALKAE